MWKKHSFSFALILLIAATIYCLITQTPQSIYFINQASDGFGWNLITHQGTNATFWWLGFSDAILNPLSNGFFAALCGILLALLFFHRVNNARIPFWQIGSASLIFSGLLLLTIGPDVVIFNFLIQFLALVISYRTLRLNLANGLWITLLGATCALLLCSQWSYLALTVAGIALWQYREQAKIQHLSLQLYSALAVIALFLALAINIQLQRPQLANFDYPASARVVPDDGVAGVITPLIGETSEIPYINRAQIKKTLQLPMLLITCFGLFILLNAKRRGSRTLPLSIIILLILFLDIQLSDSLAQIAPLKSARRILPGLFPLPINFYLFGLTLCLIFIDLITHRFALLILMTLMLAQAILYGPFFQPFALEAELKNMPLSTRLVVASPSLDLIKNEGLDIIQLAQRAKALQAKTVKELSGRISVSHQNKPKLIKLLSDHKHETRWSPSRGAQYGDEWIRINLPHAASIEGVKILPGKFFSDFARGLEIIDCAAQSTKQKLIKRIPKWIGGVDITNQGYPYYTGEHDVTIIFPQAITTTCLQINQIGEDQNFDWSIAELRILSH
jgi:hypothetical protein